MSAKKNDDFGFAGGTDAPAAPATGVVVEGDAFEGLDFSGAEDLEKLMKPVPAGDYVVQCADIDVCVSEKSGGSYIKWELRIAEGPNANRAIYENTSMSSKSDFARARIRAFLSAFGCETNLTKFVQSNQKDTMTALKTYLIDNAKQKRAQARIGIKEEQNVVKLIKPVGA